MNDDWAVVRSLLFGGRGERIQRNQDARPFRFRGIVLHDGPIWDGEKIRISVKSLKGGGNEAGADRIEQATSSNR